MLGIRVHVYGRGLSNPRGYFRYGDPNLRIQFYGPIERIEYPIGSGQMVIEVHLCWLACAPWDDDENPIQPWRATPLMVFRIPGSEFDRDRLIERTAPSLRPDDVVGLKLDANGRQIAPVELAGIEGKSGW